MTSVALCRGKSASRRWLLLALLFAGSAGFLRAQSTVEYNGGPGLRNVVCAGGAPVPDGNEVRIGFFDAGFEPAAQGADLPALARLWHEFDRTTIKTIFGQPGRFAGSATRFDSVFDQKKIYLWILRTEDNGPVAVDYSNAIESGLFTSAAVHWRFPTQGSVPPADRTMITSSEVDQAFHGSFDAQSLVLAALNTPPAISDIGDRSTAEDTPSTVAFTVSDAQTPAANLQINATSSNPAVVPPEGVVLGGSGENRMLTLTPALNQSGATTITVTVSDGTASSSDAFVLTVTPVNDPPLISDIPDQSTPEDTPTAAIAFAVDDIETPASELTLSAQSSNPNLVRATDIVFGGGGGNRSVTITPQAEQSGSATITITVSDGQVAVMEAFVLSVAPVNDPPRISEIADQNISEDTSTGPLQFSVVDLETPPQLLTVTARSSNTNLTPDLVLSGDDALRTITITPATNQFGMATITLEVSDGAVTAAEAFLLTVAAVNDPPSAAPQTIGTLEDTARLIVLTGTDIEGDPLTFLVVAGPAHGVFEGTPPELTYRPNTNYNGPDSFSFKASDGAAESAEAIVSITIEPVNDPPNAAPQTISALEDTARLIVLTGSDIEGDPLTFSVVAGPAHGVVEGTPPELTYRPNTNYNGADSFSFKASDGAAESAEATVSITIEPVNDPPVLSDIPDQQTDENQPLAPVSFALTDIDTAEGQLLIAAESSNETLVPSVNIIFGGAGTNRTVRVVPATNQTGTVTITIRASDGAATAVEVFLLTVKPVLPVILSQPASQTRAEGDSALFEVSAAGTGPIEYQWLMDGAPIIGATNHSLTLLQLQPEDAGVYSVIVSNSAGSVTSDGAVLTVTVRQAAELAIGPGDLFGQIVVRLKGSPGRYVLQGSADLTNWTTLLTTNSVDGTVEFVDGESPALPRRFYRALLE